MPPPPVARLVGPVLVVCWRRTQALTRADVGLCCETGATDVGLRLEIEVQMRYEIRLEMLPRGCLARMQKSVSELSGVQKKVEAGTRPETLKGTEREQALY